MPGTLRPVGSVGAPEVLVILVLALIVLGPDRLPQAARTLGRWVGEVRRFTGSLQSEVQGVVDEVMRPANETPTVATGAFTSTTYATAEVGATVEGDGSATRASPADVSSEPGAAEAEPPLAADVPLPSRESARSLAAPPVDPAPVDPGPVDPSLN